MNRVQRHTGCCTTIGSSFGNFRTVVAWRTASATGQSPEIPLPKEKSFVFYLRLQNPEFALFTDLTDLVSKPAPFFTNAGLAAGDGKTLKVSHRTASNTETWTVSEPTLQAEFTLAGQPLEKLDAAGFEVVQPAGSAIVTGYNSVRKTLTVDTRNVRRRENLAVRYPVQPGLARGVFAEVEIQPNTSMPVFGDDEHPFEIQLAAKSARWKYYLVTDRKDPASQFVIEDKDPLGTPVKFDLPNRTFLNEAPDPFDDLAKALARQYPDLQRFRFVSNEPVLCSNAPRRNVELRWGSQTVFGAMPNPALGNFSKIQLQRDGNPQEDSLHHVIKYLTES